MLFAFVKGQKTQVKKWANPPGLALTSKTCYLLPNFPKNDFYCNANRVFVGRNMVSIFGIILQSIYSIVNQIIC